MDQIERLVDEVEGSCSRKQAIGLRAIFESNKVFAASNQENRKISGSPPGVPPPEFFPSQ